MLSSCDWPTQTSLWKREGEQRGVVIDSSSVNNRQRAIFVFGREGGWKHICAVHMMYSMLIILEFHSSESKGYI